MGVESATAVLADTETELFGAVERPDHPRCGQDYGLCIGKGALGIAVAASIDAIEAKNGVLIDFSSPQSTRALLGKALSKKMPLVIGTTGLTENDHALARAAAEGVPV